MKHISAMRYLITGGAGFIGSHLAEELVTRGHHVHVYDNLSTGRLANIEHLFGDDRFTNTIGDILDREDLEEVVRKVDQIIHLAAITDPQMMADQPLTTVSTNIRGTENILDLAHIHDKKVLIASSGEVYRLGEGGRQDHLLTEDEDWRSYMGNAHEWAMVGGKAIDEYMALSYHREKGLPVIVVRLFDIVGPRQRSQRNALLPRLVQQAIQGMPMEIPGDGNQIRYYTYVADATWAIRRLIQVSGVEGNVYNLGSHEETTTNELAQRIREMTGSSSEIVHRSKGEDIARPFADRFSGQPDISRLCRETGYEPTYALEEILIEIITDQPAPWTIFAS